MNDFDYLASEMAKRHVKSNAKTFDKENIIKKLIQFHNRVDPKEDFKNLRSSDIPKIVHLVKNEYRLNDKFDSVRLWIEAPQHASGSTINVY